jgi:hypothetical protein
MNHYPGVYGEKLVRNAVGTAVFEATNGLHVRVH